MFGKEGQSTILEKVNSSRINQKDNILRLQGFATKNDVGLEETVDYISGEGDYSFIGIVICFIFAIVDTLHFEDAYN